MEIALKLWKQFKLYLGKGEDDVIEVCSILGAYMLKLAGKGDNLANNLKLIQRQIDNGEGLAKFKELIEFQGGDSSCLESPELLNMAKFRTSVRATKNGTIYEMDCKNIGQAIVNLGGGRKKKEDFIDNTIGIEVLKKIGDKVEIGDPLLYIYSNDESKAKEQVEFLQNSYHYADVEIPKINEIIDIIE